MVEDYEARSKTATATDAVDSIPDLASHNTREQRSYDELLSDSETYYEARKHMDDTTNDLDCVNVHGGRKDAFSLAAAQTFGAPKSFLVASDP